MLIPNLSKCKAHSGILFPFGLLLGIGQCIPVLAVISFSQSCPHILRGYGILQYNKLIQWPEVILIPCQTVWKVSKSVKKASKKRQKASKKCQKESKKCQKASKKCQKVSKNCQKRQKSVKKCRKKVRLKMTPATQKWCLRICKQRDILEFLIVKSLCKFSYIKRNCIIYQNSSHF